MSLLFPNNTVWYIIESKKNNINFITYVYNDSFFEIGMTYVGFSKNNYTLSDVEFDLLHQSFEENTNSRVQLKNTYLSISDDGFTLYVEGAESNTILEKLGWR